MILILNIETFKYSLLISMETQKIWMSTGNRKGFTEYLY
jgi:hypothetical protein